MCIMTEQIYTGFKFLKYICLKKESTFNKELQNIKASSCLEKDGTGVHFNTNNHINARLQSWEESAGIEAHFPRVTQSTGSGSRVRQGNVLSNLINYQSPGSGISARTAGALPTHPPAAP